MTPDRANTVFRQCSLEEKKRPNCQEQLEDFKAKPLQAHAAIAVIKKVFMMSQGSDDDIKEKCNLLPRSCQG